MGHLGKYLIAILLLCTACGENGFTDGTFNRYSNSAPGVYGQSVKSESCGKLNYPKYIDVENQLAVETEIETGAAHLIVHLKVNCQNQDQPTCDSMGQQAITSYIDRTNGILEVGYQWPDWAAVSVTLNEQGLRQTQQDCKIRVLEADKQEFPQ